MSHAAEKSQRFVDRPYFGLLPFDSINDVFKKFGEARRVETPLAHDEVVYYDFTNQIGLAFRVYQSQGGKEILTITIRKEKDYTKLYRANPHDGPPSNDTATEKPRSVTIPKVITKKGIALGMAKKEIESILKTKLHIKNNKAGIGWKDDEDDYYGGVDFTFSEGKLIEISWSGVDP